MAEDALKEIKALDEKLSEYKTYNVGTDTNKVTSSTHAQHNFIGTTMRSIDLDQPTHDMLAYLKEQLEDELQRTMKRLEDLSNLYEVTEKYLETVGERVQKINTALQALTTKS